ncbi:MAG: type II toxin-antitoxin system VapC family toxin [Anaerolineae bacterium]|nr:MAG: type II toxin-antitoxin system VapC family toxin [Anaerolineae bacterium]
MSYVLDASVLVAATRPNEPYHIDAQVSLQRLMAERATLFAPTIALVELAAALSRGGADASLAEQVVEAYRQRRDLEFVSVDERLAGIAATIAARQRIRGCDAIYVALAQQQRAVLITLDNEQRQRAPATVAAWTPEELLAHWRSP